VRDLMAVESQGVPAVLAVIGWLTSIAEETKNTGGMSEVAIVPIERSFFGLSREEIADAVRPFGPPVAAALVA
jgi:hypothetical protein